MIRHLLPVLEAFLLAVAAATLTWLVLSILSGGSLR